MLLAEQLPGRAEFGGAVTNLVAEAERAGVRVFTRSHVTREVIEREAPEAVVLATGARPRRITLELADPTADNAPAAAWRASDPAPTPGAVNRMLSSTSRTPPMPGTMPPESLTLAARLKSDSVRSPTTAQMERKTPRGMARTQVRPKGTKVSRNPQTNRVPTRAARSTA